MYNLSNVDIKTYSNTLREYRGDKELHGIYLEYYKRYKEKYPEYFNFISEAQEKFYDSSMEELTMGADYGFYLYMTDYIIDHKPKHIIEYGPGFTTLLLHRIVQDIDHKVEVYSYEDNEKWFENNKRLGFDPFGTMELVDMELEVKGGLVYATYIHDVEKHKDVDCIIIDGPGPLEIDGVNRPSVTTNADLLEKTFDREIRTLIEGRHHTQQFMHINYKERTRSITIDD